MQDTKNKNRTGGTVMAKLNSHNILILRKLVENGYHTKRDIVGLPMYELLRIRTLSRRCP